MKKFDMASAVLSLVYTNSCFVVAMENQVFVNALDVNFTYKIHTSANPKGTLAASLGPKFCVAAPAETAGAVTLTWFQRFFVVSHEGEDCNRFSSESALTITAHYTEVACLALSHDGKLVVTASGKVSL